MRPLRHLMQLFPISLLRMTFRSFAAHRLAPRRIAPSGRRPIKSFAVV